MITQLRLAFPGLARSSCFKIIEANPSEKRNCICHAVSDRKERWYWPGKAPNDYWPPSLARVVSLSSFKELFEARSYTTCDEDDYVEGVEKVAVFTLNDVPKHAALQLPDGLWSSKIGKHSIIAHAIEDLNGNLYGKPVLFMARNRLATSLSKRLTV